MEGLDRQEVKEGLARQEMMEVLVRQDVKGRPFQTGSEGKALLDRK
jgi:hypothetical protein